MKTFHKLFPIFLVCIFAFGLVFSAPTFAAEDNNAVSTTFFGDFKDDGKGCGVYMVLNTGLDILSMGIGIAAIIGILVSGTLYLTAKGNENQVVKSKKRILEIVIGLAVYAALYAGLNFILPGGKLNTNVQCTATTVSSNYGTTNEWRTRVTDQNDGAKSTSSSSSSSAEPSSDETDLSKWYEAMEKQFKYMKKAKYGSNYKSIFELSKREGTCITFVSTSLQRLGVIPKNKYVWISAKGKITGSAASFIKKHKDTFEIFYPNKTAKQLKKESKIKKGDIVAYNVNRGKSNDASHIMVFMGFNKKSKPTFNTWGHYRKLNSEHSSYANRKINMIIRLKKTSL